jgi:hypothetical protein
LPCRRGKLATAISLFNVFFGERLECRRIQLVGEILFADAYWGGTAAYMRPGLNRKLAGQERCAE